MSDANVVFLTLCSQYLIEDFPHATVALTLLSQDIDCHSHSWAHDTVMEYLGDWIDSSKIVGISAAVSICSIAFGLVNKSLQSLVLTRNETETSSLLNRLSLIFTTSGSGDGGGSRGDARIEEQGVLCELPGAE